jgi:hypothetical protein
MWSQTGYLINLPAKLFYILSSALITSAILIFLAWLGTGVDIFFTRIKDVKSRRLVSLAVYLGSLLLCIVLPAAVILYIYLTPPVESGWQKLSPFPETPVQISALGKASVVIKSNSGNYYLCIVKETSSCWRQQSEPSSHMLENYGGELHDPISPPEVDPPGEVVAVQSVLYNQGATMIESHYAILTDGTVWYLNREVNNGTASFEIGLALTLFLPIIIGMIMILLGAGLNAFSRHLAKKDDFQKSGL